MCAIPFAHIKWKKWCLTTGMLTKVASERIQNLKEMEKRGWEETQGQVKRLKKIFRQTSKGSNEANTLQEGDWLRATVAKMRETEWGTQWQQGFNYRVLFWLPLPETPANISLSVATARCMCVLVVRSCICTDAAHCTVRVCAISAWTKSPHGNIVCGRGESGPRQALQKTRK